jgi:homoserine kinase
MPRDTAIAFAPASVGNVAVGFDILGHSVPVMGDRVRATRIPGRGVRIAGITGVVTDLPVAAERNTAGMAVTSLIERLGLDHGFELTIEKGIPLGSGLGGSAASAVAAVVAANALLDQPADPIDLLKCAIRGEAVASGTAHVDNIAPSLYGGLVLTVGIDEPIVRQIPVPDVVRCVLVHPHMELATRASRGVLQRTTALSDFVWQQANLAGFLTGCFTGDVGLIRASMIDVVIEPQRKALIPGFDAVKDAAQTNGSLGCSISGGGPTVFAWCEEARAEPVRDAMVRAFDSHGVGSDAWIVPIENAGARLA